MNPSTALATVLVDELVRQGVRHVVLCPGSRSAPFAYAVQAAEREGRLTLHVRVDERSAGFLALGLGKLTRTPAVVVTTSGTAVANLHPAVLEAHHGVVPLVVLSADRPVELRGTGANQTTVQPGLFGDAPRWNADLPAPGAATETEALSEAREWRTTARLAFGAATGGAGEPGPVHVNVQLREPLVPTDEPHWPGPLHSVDARASQQKGGAADPDGRVRGDTPATGAETAFDPVPERTLVVIGDLPEPGQFERAVAWATSHGWPVLAEPFGAHPRHGVLPHGPLVLSEPGWLDAHAPERVLAVGRLTLSRPVAGLLRRPGTRVEAVGTHAWVRSRPGVTAVHHVGVLDRAGPGGEESAWAKEWRAAGERLTEALAAAPSDWPTGPAVAECVVRSLPPGATLFLGSSNAVRDVDLIVARRAEPLTVVANRGLAGIDGCVSTAAGLALGGAHPAYALMGDLTFLHDANGLLVGPHEQRPDLTVVVVNDDGGGIFTLLEPGEPGRRADFERVFGTPTRTDLAALCAAHGVPHERVDTSADLAAAAARPSAGLRVVEVRVDRASHRDEHARLRAVARKSLQE